MRKYKSDVIGKLKVAGVLYEYGDEFYLTEEEYEENKQLAISKQIIRIYD